MPSASVAESEPGAHVEDKGAAVAVHLRNVPDPDAATARLGSRLAAIAERAGLALLEGKRVLELAPPGRGKGAAVLRLAEGAQALLVAGDDLADLDAFDAADELAGSGLAVCRVVVGDPKRRSSSSRGATSSWPTAPGGSSTCCGRSEPTPRARSRSRSCCVSHLAGLLVSTARTSARARRVRSSSGSSSAVRIAFAVSSTSNGFTGMA